MPILVTGAAGFAVTPRGLPAGSGGMHDRPPLAGLTPPWNPPVLAAETDGAAEIRP